VGFICLPKLYGKAGSLQLAAKHGIVYKIDILSVCSEVVYFNQKNLLWDFIYSSLIFRGDINQQLLVDRGVK